MNLLKNTRNATTAFAWCGLKEAGAVEVTAAALKLRGRRASQTAVAEQVEA